jgi:DNA adenine methylase
MKLTAITPWFGSKRTLAPEIVRQLGRHSYYFEGCCGSLAVLLAKPPSEHETVCDLHGALTNLAWVVQHELMAVKLFNGLQRVLYADDIYLKSKAWLAEHEQTLNSESEPALDWAYHYFIASWMGRNGIAGTARFNYQIATRWTHNGGSGPLRFRNAVDSIPEWCERLRNVHILRRDLFACLAKLEDAEGTAIYVDPPYLPDSVSGTSKYLHNFTAADHRRLADLLTNFHRARVVVSYYDSPELANLYPACAGWSTIDCPRHKHLHVQNKRGSTVQEAPEVLIVNGEPVPKPASEAWLFAD